MRTNKKIWNASLILLLLLGVQLIASSAFQKESPTKIELHVLPGLQFNLPRFHVKPGAPVELVFTNTDDMDHNLLILNPGQREKVVQKAMDLGVDALRKNYVPNDPDILWHTPILHDGQSKTLHFKAPDKEGVYPYVCTLPGHGFVMYGAMYVSKEDNMPPIEKDSNVPPTRMKADEHHLHHKASHPYKLEPPYLYRLYIEGSGPAAIAVHLPEKLSYCWDAGACRLRFAWQGDFVDNTLLWKGHKDARAAVLGTIFYTENQKTALSIGNSTLPQEHRFKGYRITKAGYPEFRYLVHGVEVFELIQELKGGAGIVRTFRIPTLNETVSLHLTTAPNVQHTVNGKPITGTVLQLSAAEGKQFSIETKNITHAH
ncbi:plastocyanin/azurin family copper-binding protein [Sphingobacterium paucimobilis]|uniref:Blue (type 1) copper domain-containing protein n=1 Tax=Sphingobacterium paucimobilis HER1398 TaxID=1346330 RepID=U2HB28_9SPHI|nr:plastocyanin/azurin family copper-binding protein [Sphingobacterium paucimobilis]ERJ58951.1 hypothetical protein M472_09220 [Sphingobacterium paucimobilis HER1398]